LARRYESKLSNTIDSYRLVQHFYGSRVGILATTMSRTTYWGPQVTFLPWTTATVIHASSSPILIAFIRALYFTDLLVTFMLPVSWTILTGYFRRAAVQVIVSGNQRLHTLRLRSALLRRTRTAVTQPHQLVGLICCHLSVTTYLQPSNKKLILG